MGYCTVHPSDTLLFINQSNRDISVYWNYKWVDKEAKKCKEIVRFMEDEDFEESYYTRINRSKSCIEIMNYD